MFIKVMKLTKDVQLVGFAQMAALKLLAKTPGYAEPEKGTITARGKLRKHTINDLVMRGFVQVKVDRAKGGVLYMLTNDGRKAIKDADVAKKPPSGYKKVLPRRKPVTRRVAVAA